MHFCGRTRIPVPLLDRRDAAATLSSRRIKECKPLFPPHKDADAMERLARVQVRTMNCWSKYLVHNNFIANTRQIRREKLMGLLTIDRLTEDVELRLQGKCYAVSV